MRQVVCLSIWTCLFWTVYWQYGIGAAILMAIANLVTVFDMFSEKLDALEKAQRRS